MDTANEKSKSDDQDSDVEKSTTSTGTPDKKAADMNTTQPTESKETLFHKIKYNVMLFFGLEPFPTLPIQEIIEPLPAVVSFFLSLRLFIPYSPALTKPGWAVEYVKGFINPDSRVATFENFVGDVMAGITVSLLLIPQALSYAILAKVPAVTGLYTAILPAAVYAVFGSCMQLAVGPVAISSLLTGSLVTLYGITPETPEAVDLATQASMGMGIILVGMSVLNIGSLIRFISYPVMSGFTTAAACLIGLSQLKNAFGFSVPIPQQGDADTHWNYQVMAWYANHWNDTFPVDNTAKSGKLFRNPVATNICFGIYVPLILIQRLKMLIKATPERKKTIWFKCWVYFSNLASFVGIIVAGKVAYDIISANYSNGKYTDYYVSKLKIVGPIVPGINIIRIPSFKQPWGQLFLDILPLTFITFMESYSIAAKLATTNNQLHLLSSSQELWAIGMANIIGSVGSAYPVAGSYSRSSLLGNVGGKTLLSTLVTMCAILVCLGAATSALFFVPNAALAAVIWVALFNIIAFTEWWEAYISSFKDFFVMITTFMITFVLDTSIGLAVGLAVSVFVFLFESILSKRNGPTSKQVGIGRQRIELIRLNNNLNFLTIPRIKDFISFDILMGNDRPHAIIIDFIDVKHVDLTVLKAFEEIKAQCHELKILFFLTNIIPEVDLDLKKFHIQSDEIPEDDENVENPCYYGNMIKKSKSSEKVEILSKKEIEEISVGTLNTVRKVRSHDILAPFKSADTYEPEYMI